jgi:polysaccharide pyruvyl transferase WcaK-like protein
MTKISNKVVNTTKIPRIILLGNNSGRNLGDAAIMSSILESMAKLIPTAEVFVPSIAPKWIKKHYGDKYKVKPIDVMPWTGSLRLLGIPTFIAIAKSDVALICDGIIFGKKLFNPAFNYLITLIFVVPWAKLVGCKVVCYSCGIGPFPSKISRLFAKWVINGSDLIMMRENDSIQLCKEIGVTNPIIASGDAAFINPVSSRERAFEIAKTLGIDLTKPTIAINITKYLDSWLRPEEKVGNKDQFIEMLSDGLKKVANDTGVQYLVISTQPMDENICKTVATKINGKIIDNSTYLSHDIQAVMRECKLLIGMRFHSLVLASAVGTPIIGLVYAPKVKGFLRLLESEDYSLELSQLTVELIDKQVKAALKELDQLKQRQQLIVAKLKVGAEKAAIELKKRYFPDV